MCLLLKYASWKFQIEPRNTNHELLNQTLVSLVLVGYWVFDPEQKKGNRKLLLKHILRQFNSEDAKGSDDGAYSWASPLKWKYKTTGKKQRNLVAVSSKLFIIRSKFKTWDTMKRRHVFFS